MMALNTIRDAKTRCITANTQEERKIIVQLMGEELEELRISWNKMTLNDISMTRFKKEFGIPE